MQSWVDKLPLAIGIDPRPLGKALPGFFRMLVSEIRDRVSELPAQHETVFVLDCEDAAEALATLRGIKRLPKVVSVGDSDAENVRLWSVPQHLIQIAEQPGKVIDLGCGAGRDSVWLSTNGWQVTAVDRLVINLEVGRNIEKNYTQQDKITWLQANVLELVPEPIYDLVLLHYCYDAEYFAKAKKWVKPGGILSLIAHSELHWRCFDHPKKPRVPASFDEEILEAGSYWSRDRHSAYWVLKINDGLS
jgi:SAM-dependent methyltransferase